MFTRFEEQWHCCGGARLGGAMQTRRLSYAWDFIPRKNEERRIMKKEKEKRGVKRVK